MNAGRLWVDASGVTLTVGSHAVTNAGTFLVQAQQSGTWDEVGINDSGNSITVDGTTVTDGAGALNVICDSGCAGGAQFAEDAAHTTGDSGTMLLAVRNDAGTALAGTTGDYIPLTTDASGALRVVGSSGTTQFAEDIAHTTGDATVFISGIRRDTTPSSSAGTAGDYTAINVDGNGRLYTQAVLYNSSGAEITVATDQTLDAALGTSGPLLVGRGSTATPAAMSADNDATAFWLDSNGRAHITTEKAEDAAHSSGDSSGRPCSADASTRSPRARAPRVTTRR